MTTEAERLLTAVAGWCAPSQVRFTLAEAHAAVGVPAWWRTESPGEARERRIRERWALEDAWLEGQLKLTRTTEERDERWRS